MEIHSDADDVLWAYEAMTETAADDRRDEVIVQLQRAWEQFVAEELTDEQAA